MKKQIRFGVFETNSSSTHTLVICTEQEFNDWKNGKLALDYNKLVPAPEKPSEEVIKEYYDKYFKEEYEMEYNDLSYEGKVDILNQYVLDNDEPQTYAQWYDDEYLEIYESSYTTEHGDKIVVFGKYGSEY